MGIVAAMTGAFGEVWEWIVFSLLDTVWARVVFPRVSCEFVVL
jgi:hypothetical protein